MLVWKPINSFLPPGVVPAGEDRQHRRRGAPLVYKRGEPRVCAVVKAPTPDEEDRRRLCR
jgi:hypothetical protein